MRFVGAGVLVSNFVFFKQKTAYELRISDWSSDVCSSDLLGFAVVIVTIFAHSFSASWWARRLGIDKGKELGVLLIGANGWTNAFGSALKQYGLAVTVARSEEHTSELQSLMRISYAVFCLKKKNKNKKQVSTTPTREIQKYE